MSYWGQASQREARLCRSLGLLAIAVMTGAIGVATGRASIMEGRGERRVVHLIGLVANRVVVGAIYCATLPLFGRRTSRFKGGTESCRLLTGALVLLLAVGSIIGLVDRDRLDRFRWVFICSYVSVGLNSLLCSLLIKWNDIDELC